MCLGTRPARPCAEPSEASHIDGCYAQVETSCAEPSVASVDEPVLVALGTPVGFTVDAWPDGCNELRVVDRFADEPIAGVAVSANSPPSEPVRLVILDSGVEYTATPCGQIRCVSVKLYLILSEPDRIAGWTKDVRGTNSNDGE